MCIRDSNYGAIIKHSLELKCIANQEQLLNCQESATDDENSQNGQKIVHFVDVMPCLFKQSLTSQKCLIKLRQDCCITPWLVNHTLFCN